MNKIKLKIFCIFLILIYCLAPLSAIDLNQDNITADNNQTIDNIDGEIEIANETTDEATNHTGDNEDIIVDNITDDSSKDIDAKSIEIPNAENETECDDLELIDPDLRVEIKSIEVGEKPVIIVHTNKKLSGRFVFAVYDRDSHPGRYCTAGFIYVENGYGERIINDDIPSGNYTLEVMYFKTYDSEFDEADVFCDFSVNKINPNLRVEVPKFKADEVPYAVVFSKWNFSENVTVKLNNSHSSYSVKPVNGVGIVDLEKLPAGNYTVSASFEETKKYTSSESSKNFEIEKYDPNLSINVKNSAADEKTIIEIHGNNSLSKSVNLKLNDSKEFPVKLKNGTATVRIDDLTPGNYSATVSYDGDEIFDSSEKTAQFVKTGTDDLNLRIQINDTLAGTCPVAEVYADESFNSIKSGLNLSSPKFHCSYLPIVKNGYGSVNLWNESKLAPGNYTVIVTFDGDEKYRACSATTTFSIAKGDPDLSVHVDDVHNKRENASVKVNAHKLLNGTVKVDLRSASDSKTVMVNVTDGVGEATVSNFQEGKYTVDATFEGNNQFMPSNASTSFNVVLAEPNLSIHVDEMGYGGRTVFMQINANESLNGDVKVKIKSDNDYDEATVKLVDGVGDTKFEGLSPGTYSAKATFDGNDIITSGTTNTTFIVKRVL